ncbi:MAG: cilia- and flagella-associated protein 54 [Planctomycetes bacterium]|nr:cilia- and flagella-associated protein 54 [Planctomycetota bacterium]
MTTGESADAAEAKPVRATIAAKPMMVYVMSDDPTDSATRKLDSVAFAKEQVGVGSKFFECIKMTSGDAAQDRITKDSGKQVPRIIFMKRDYTVVSVLEGNELSGGGIVKAMQQVVRTEYVNNFDTMVRDYISLLNDLDRLESKKAAIEDQKRRVAEKANKSKEKKIARDEEEYKAEMEAFEAQEKKILEFKFKGENEKPADDTEA